MLIIFYLLHSCFGRYSYSAVAIVTVTYSRSSNRNGTSHSGSVGPVAQSV